MRLQQQFDLNRGSITALGREFLTIPPYIIEELVVGLTKKGYTVLKSSINFMGIPRSITVVKEFTGPFVTSFSLKIREDFRNVSQRLGIERLFE